MFNIRQAVIYSAASRYASRLLGLISTMLIARLLTPGEIGTFAIASAIVMVMSEFRLLGAGSYLVREKDIPEHIIRSALGLTLIISWGLGVLVFFSASYISEFYNIPQVETIFRILSISFFMAPYISIPSALLSRTYQFKSLLYIQLSAQAVGLLGTIGLILLGFSFYALAWGHIVVILVEFLIMSKFRPEGTPWLPVFTGLGPIASFGIYTSLSNLLKKAIVTTPDMVIGKLGTTTQVGMFSRGLGFVDFLSQSLMMGIAPVALPYLSQSKHAGGDVSLAYTRASVLLGGMVLPVLAVASLSSLPAIRLFFGGQWDSAASLASWLALWAILRSVHALSNPLMIACGKEKVMVIKDLVVFLAFFFGIIVAFPYGLEAIAITFIIAGIFDLVVTTILLWKTINLSIMKFISAWLPNLGVSAVCWGATFIISLRIDFASSNYWSPILVIALVLPPVWVVTLKIFRHPLYSEIIALLQSLYKKVRM